MKNVGDVGANNRIALFGGSFDPIHCGHLEIAKCAIDQAKLNSVIFIPSAQAPLKNEHQSSADLRSQMLRLALEDFPNFLLDTHEVEQGGVSFTINTVEHFKRRYQDAELFWIIGGDQFVQLDQWSRINELAQMLTFLVYPRGGSFQANRNSIKGLHYQVLEARQLSESSTEIRKRCKKGLPLSSLVPEKVEAFIYKNGLYDATS